jgi:hypothetical protein
MYIVVQSGCVVAGVGSTGSPTSYQYITPGLLSIIPSWLKQLLLPTHPPHTSLAALNSSLNTFPSCVSLVQPLPLKAPKFLFVRLMVAQMELADDQMNTFPSCVSLVQPLPWLRSKAPKFLFVHLMVAQMEPTDDQMNTDVLGT